MRLVLAVALVLASTVAITVPPAASAVAAEQDPSNSTSREQREVWRRIQPGITILHDDMAEMLLRQCSRGVPEAYDGRWTPTREEIDQVERQLFEGNRQLLVRSGIEGTVFPDGYHRWYGGFTRDGVSYIYGSYGPRGAIVCDGGPAHFGVEYAMPEGEVTHVAFNGHP